MGLSANTFADDIAMIVAGGASYIDAVSSWCALNGVEPEVGADLVQAHPLIRDRIQMEAECLNLVK